MNTYFEINFNRPEYNKIYLNMSEAITAIEKNVNQDRVIAESVIEKDSQSNRIVTIYKVDLSAKLIWTEIPKYNGATLVS
jgi:hypothetical protein